MFATHTPTRRAGYTLLYAGLLALGLTSCYPEITVEYYARPITQEYIPYMEGIDAPTTGEYFTLDTSYSVLALTELHDTLELTVSLDLVWDEYPREDNYFDWSYVCRYTYHMFGDLGEDNGEFYTFVTSLRPELTDEGLPRATFSVYELFASGDYWRLGGPINDFEEEFGTLLADQPWTDLNGVQHTDAVVMEGLYYDDRPIGMVYLPNIGIAHATLGEKEFTIIR